MSAEPPTRQPLSRSSGSSALVTRLTASTLISNIARQSSASHASTLARPERAARVVDEGVRRAGRREVVAQAHRRRPAG